MYITLLQQSNSYNIYSMISVQNIIRLYMEELSTPWFHLWIQNYCHHIPPCEAYSWLWDFCTPSICIGPWGASPLVLHNYWVLHC